MKIAAKPIRLLSAGERNGEKREKERGLFAARPNDLIE